MRSTISTTCSNGIPNNCRTVTKTSRFAEFSISSTINNAALITSSSSASASGEATTVSLQTTSLSTSPHATRCVSANISIHTWCTVVISTIRRGYTIAAAVHYKQRRRRRCECRAFDRARRKGCGHSYSKLLSTCHFLSSVPFFSSLPLPHITERLLRM